MWRSTMKGIPSALATFVAVLAVGVAIAMAADGETSPGDGDRTVVVQTGPGLPELLEPFRRAKEARDRIPGGDPLEALAQTGDAQPGENPRLARRLHPAGDRDVFVWPKADGLCAQWGMAGVCFPLSRLRARGVLIGLSYRREASPQWELLVLARDGIGRVEVTFADGRVLSRAVEDNSVFLGNDSPPSAVTWSNPDGSRGFEELPEPSV
jgi:hypothetical protein